MARKNRSRRTGHAHEQHVVLVRQCSRCARWVVLHGKLDHVTAYHDEDSAIAYAEYLREKIIGRPDPDPLQVEVIGPGHVVATGSTPAASIEAPAAA